MKKIFFILLSVTLVLSCSSDDDESSNSSNFINPPDWILGTWQDVSDPEWSRSGGFQFTNDNLLELNTDGDVFLNLKESLQNGIDNDVITTNEEISSTNYVLEIISHGSVDISYEFSKNSDNSITQKITTTISVELTKQ